jgi:hypothetical protein
VNTTPYFKIALVTLATLVAVVGCILNNAVNAADLEPTAKAPIVEPADDGLLIQTGWFTYPRMDTAAVLYCVREPKAPLVCAMYVTTDDGNGIGFFAMEEEA